MEIDFTYKGNEAGKLSIKSEWLDAESEDIL